MLTSQISSTCSNLIAKPLDSVACWSISFYPQPIFNFRRGSTDGLSIDFPIINSLGFVCYTIYNTAFLYSSVVRSQYAARHPLSEEPTVRFNDLAFAVHAVILSVIAYSQFWPAIWGLKVFRAQRISKPIAVLFWGSILVPLLVVLIVTARSPDGGYDPSSWAWIDVVSTLRIDGMAWHGMAWYYTLSGIWMRRLLCLPWSCLQVGHRCMLTSFCQIYSFSYVKLVITVIKYLPQAWLNYKRKSTEGWSISQILLDLTGGILSLVQLVLDSSLQGDWSGITGNPVKLLLGNITIVSDVIFVVQHYVLYRDKAGSKAPLEGDVTSPLLGDSGTPRGF